jgi:Peptidase inhibitor I78 family
MPLIPSTSNPTISTNDTQSWVEKLMGKTISDSHSSTSFAKKDLPEKHRVVGEGDMVTMDHKPDRLNVHVDKDGTVRKVTHG